MLIPVDKDSEDATILNEHTEVKRKELTDSQLHKMLKQQLIGGGKRPDQVSLIQGQLSRFYK